MDLNVSPVRLNEIAIKSSKNLNINPKGLDLFEDGDKIYVFIVNYEVRVSSGDKRARMDQVFRQPKNSAVIDAKTRLSRALQSRQVRVKDVLLHWNNHIANGITTRKV